MGKVTLSIFVSDVDGALADYDVIQVERSVDGEGGPFVDTTAETAAAAVLIGTENSPFNLDARTLELKVDDADQVDITFSGTDPISIASVVTAINTAVGDTVAFDDGGKLKLESTLTGTASKMEVVGGTSLTELGFTAGDRDVGEDAHIPLTAGIQNYTYDDLDGDADYYYAVAFLNTTTQAASSFSPPFQGDAGAVVPSSNMSIAKVDLIDHTGAAVEGQEVSIYSVHEPIEVAGFHAAVVRTPKTLVTNAAGHAETPLVKGLKVRVVFDGTSLVREITVPDDVDEFDLLAAVASAPDPYEVLTPDIPFAVRRTL